MRMWKDDDSRSVLIGLLAVLVVHLLLFGLAPVFLRSQPSSLVARKDMAARDFNIEIAPEAFNKKVMPKPAPPSKYVEANPNAPENVPDRTNNFSSRNSQLAQEKPQADAHNDTPQLTGKKDIQSNQVISGQLTKPQESAPPIPESVPNPAKAEAAARRMQTPLSGFEKSKEGDEGFGSNIGKVPDQAKPVPNKVDGTSDALVDGQNNEPVIDPRHPQARRSLEHQQTRPAIFRDNPIGTANIGVAAYDAKWSNYGVYLHKMMEAIQAQWERILIDSHTEPPSGTTVTAKFTLDSKGKITEILQVESTSTEQGKQSCVSAITLTAPYGDWTDDMIAMLGNSQDLTFVFYYE